jgi:hypothetical protein
MHDITTSIPSRDETRLSCEEVMEKGWIVSPREARVAFAAFETDVGRVSEIMLAGMEPSLARRPSTIERPV